MSSSWKSTRSVIETEEVRATVSSSPEALRIIGSGSVRRRRSASSGVNGYARPRRGGAQKTASSTIQYFLVVGHLMFTIFAGITQCSGVENSERLMRSLLLNPYYLNPTAAFYDRAPRVTDQLLGGGERYYLDADGQPRMVSEYEGDGDEPRRAGAKLIVVARHVDGGAAKGNDAESPTTKISLTELLAATAAGGSGNGRRLPYRSALFRRRRSIDGGMAVAPALGPRRQRRRDSFLLAVPFSDYTPTPCRWKLCASMFTPSTTMAMFK